MNASLFIGHDPDCAYVYIWYSRTESVVYIGQTNDRDGVLGRASKHLSRQGSLRMCLEEGGYILDDIDDLLLLSYPLPKDGRYTGAESTGRESVEYHVQVALRRRIFDRHIVAVSTVRYIPFVDEHEAEELAERIMDDFEEIVRLCQS